MALDDLPRYVDMVKDLQESVSGIRVRFGIEMDYLPGQMDAIWGAAAGCAFDYVYGSVHYIDEWGFNDSRNVAGYKGKDPDRLYARYFELFCEAAERGGFDIMAHPDIIKKHGLSTTLPIERLYAEAAEALRRADVAIEINTSGLRKTAVEIYPALPFLRACGDRGVAVTLGSDAHAPREVGMDFDLALALLQKAGHLRDRDVRGPDQDDEANLRPAGRGRRDMTETRPLNPLAAMTLVLVYPRKTFERLVERPRWILPLVFVVLRVDGERAVRGARRVHGRVPRVAGGGGGDRVRRT